MTADLAERVSQIYERHAAEWDADRNSNPWNDKGWIIRFVEAVPNGARVLDLGCGPGEPVARFLAASGLQITGADTSPTLIALCRERLPNHTWLVGDMRTLTLDERFQGILAWDSYFFLRHDDQRQMFKVFATHAAPGAALMFNTGPTFGEAIGTYRGEPLYHASLAAAEYESLLDQFGFEVVEHMVEDAKAGGRTVWLARALS